MDSRLPDAHPFGALSRPKRLSCRFVEPSDRVQIPPGQQSHIEKAPAVFSYRGLVDMAERESAKPPFFPVRYCVVTDCSISIFSLALFNPVRYDPPEPNIFLLGELLGW